MKKLIFLFVCLFAFVAIQAQDVTLRMGSSDKTYLEYNTDKGVGNGADVWYKIIGDQNEPTCQDFICNLDSLKGGAMTTTVKLYGTKFTTEGWTQIGSTVTWTGSSADTTIVFSNATAARWRDYKFNVHVASGDSVKIDYLKFKLWQE